MAYLVVLKGDDIDDAESKCALATELDAAVDYFCDFYGYAQGTELDVYEVTDKKSFSVRVKRAKHYSHERIRE